MRTNIIAFMSAAAILAGCSSDHDDGIVSASDLARELGVTPVLLALPDEAYERQELFFLVRETSDGDSHWQIAFNAPNPGGTVKLLLNSQDDELNILVDDETLHSWTILHMGTSRFARNSGWPEGLTSVDDYVIHFANTDEGMLAAKGGSSADEEVQTTADHAVWARLSLIAASQVPEDAPPSIHRIIEMSDSQP